jgi:hypothetical protein
VNALHYLAAYLGIFLEFWDHKAAKRAGELAVHLANKRGRA